jgi:hypothetical protein
MKWLMRIFGIFVAIWLFGDAYLVGHGLKVTPEALRLTFLLGGVMALLSVAATILK